jgi:large repetitive protein
VRVARLGVFIVGLALLLEACGRAPSTSTATETPSPTASTSPSAEPTPLAITGPTLHMGEVGLAYAPVTYQATGGNAPYIVWTVSAGTLPGGMSMSLDGVISGTPTASGTFNFTVEINDSAMATANLSGAINIVPRLTLHYVGEMAATGAVAVCTDTYPARCSSPTDNRYAPFAAVSGGAAPFTYSILSGTLPAGTRLSALALAGTFPTDDRLTYRFTVLVTDSVGATATIVAVYNLWHYMNIHTPPIPSPSPSP